MPALLDARSQEAISHPPFQRWNPRPDARSSTEFHHTDRGVLVRFPGVADFLVAASGVSCYPVPGSGDAWQPLFEQQVRPLVLADRGAPIFHGGAVVVDGGAVAFLAPSGRGKSTLTTAFARRGMPFLSDDCLQLDVDGDILVVPQAAFVRLWEDSIAGAAPEHAERGHGSGSPKPRILSGAALPHCNSAMPLRAVYLIDEACPALPEIAQLTLAEAMMGWTANAFVLDISSRSVLQRSMNIAARLAKAVPVRKLAYPRDYAVLDAVVDAILSDMASRDG